MPLIDHTYFIGEINLPNTNKADVQSRLNFFIEKYQQKFLTELLGYELYGQLMAGLLENPISQRWMDLLYGTSYTYNSVIKNWPGLVEVPLSVSPTVNSGSMTLIAGRGLEYDPLPGSNTTTIAPQFVGKPFIFQRRGIGQLTEFEYTTEGNVFTLADGEFVEGEIDFITLNSSVTLNPDYTLPVSLIANYVYYYWMRNEATQTTAVGEVMTKTENAERVSPSQKMVGAWNEMVNKCWNCVRFLDANSDTYPEWTQTYYTSYGYHYGYPELKDIFYPINTFNL